MARSTRRRIPIAPIDRYSAQDAANTISRAREHLANPKMVKAIKAHIDGLSGALNGPLKPKSLRLGKKVPGGL